MTTKAKSQAGLLKGLETHIANPFLNLATVAVALGVSSDTVSRWIKSERIKATRFPYGWKVRKSDLVDILENGFPENESSEE